MKYLLTAASAIFALSIASSCKKKSSSGSSPAPVVETPAPQEPSSTPANPATPTTTALSGFNCTSNGVFGIGSDQSMIIDTTQNRMQLTRDGESRIYSMTQSAEKVWWAPQSTRYDLTLIGTSNQVTDTNQNNVSTDDGYLVFEPDTINYLSKEDRGYRHSWLYGVSFNSKKVYAKLSCPES